MKTIQLITKYSTRIILALFVVLALGFTFYTESQKINLKNFTLVSTEEFDATALSDAWLLAEDGSFHYTGFYSNDQVSVADGKLKIRLSKEGGIKGDQLYSTMVRSAQSYTTGYFEVTATLPKINEFNAIIALSSDEALGNTDPSQGAKIVFASSNNQPYPLLATGIYYDNLGDPTETQNAFVLSLIYNESHRYGLLWTPTNYAFYFDGVKLWESTKTAVSTEALYLTFGFDFPYYTTQDISALDQTFSIDSVKIYTLNP